MRLQSFLKFLNVFLTSIPRSSRGMIILCLCVMFCTSRFSYSQENIAVEQKLIFTSPENIQKTVADINNPDILTISFGFDPYTPKVLENYLPDGYITVNGEYDTNELILKTFLSPILENNNIKFLILDISPLLKNPTQQKVLNIKTLVEKTAAFFAKKQRSIEMGLKFKYEPNSRGYIDTLFSYTEIPLIVKSIQIEKGYSDFFAQKSYQSFLNNLKYLNLSSNVIGSQKENFNNFVVYLKKLKRLEILNLSDNAMGAVNGNLKLFTNQITMMPQLKYINLENNLIGANKAEAQEFIKSIQQIKHIAVNLNYNLN